MDRENQKKIHTSKDRAKVITELWKEYKGIKQCFNGSNEFQHDTSVVYRFDNILKSASKDYIYFNTAILMSKLKKKNSLNKF